MYIAATLYLLVTYEMNWSVTFNNDFILCDLFVLTIFVVNNKHMYLWIYHDRKQKQWDSQNANTQYSSVVAWGVGDNVVLFLT